MKSNHLAGYGALAIAGFYLFVGSMANAAPTGKTEICHKPGERNQRILNINLEKDGPKHFGHGDHLVSTLPNCDTIPDNNCDGIPDDTADGDELCVAETGDEGATCNTNDGDCVTPAPPCPCDYQAAVSAYTTNGGDISSPWDTCGAPFTGSFTGIQSRDETFTTNQNKRTIINLLTVDDATANDPTTTTPQCKTDVRTITNGVDDTVESQNKFPLTPEQLNACRNDVVAICAP